MIYFKLSGGLPINYLSYLHTEKGFIESIIQYRFLSGIFYGFMVSLFLYNLLLFFSLKEKVYLYFSLIALALVVASQVFSLLGVFPFHPLFFGAISTVGAALEAILVSLVLADKINILKKQREDEQKLFNQRLELLEKLSTIDSLTQLYNRYKVENVLKSKVELGEQLGEPLSLILLDIDYFKQVNDRYGHQEGDKVLTAFAGLLKETVRDTDIVGRWGGEEFMIVCPNTSLGDATRLADMLREKIEQYSFPIVRQKTSSFGVSCYQKGDESSQLISRADQALYKAKEKGRNRVEVEYGATA
ncbi:GGDEF domain-containing protein [Aneurinibacillus tyrosinisolvens]|uniref:GGDEF domain-containing protein n=1 Tax=Aneurinibacillus tyrosinisolvens TaxID=1443435 RepID=UPI000A63A2F9|nr:GGDEF domain-containing protein [Aneurinibacillus tyrosinisolvens]